MARPREPIDLIVAKGRKHLTKQEYEDRKNSEIIAPADNVKAPPFLTKKERVITSYSIHYTKLYDSASIISLLAYTAIATGFRMPGPASEIP